jgi:hypothetical protein
MAETNGLAYFAETWVMMKKRFRGLDAYKPRLSSCSFATDTKLGWKNTAMSKGLAYFAGTWEKMKKGLWL